MKKEISLNKNEIYKGRVLTYEVHDVLCPNGRKSKREIVRHPGGVCILAVYQNKIILEKQYRFPYDDFIIELPAGKLEKGENPKEAGIRELEEEVGLVANDLIDMGVMYPSVGYTDEKIYMYLAIDVKEGKQHLDIDEDLEIMYIDIEKAKEMIDSGEIKDAKSIILILKYLDMIKN